MKDKNRSTLLMDSDLLLAIKDHMLIRPDNEYGVKVREYPDRYVLNYDQVDSSKYKFEPVVMACRNLIVSKDLERVLHRSFDRFFNYGEDPSAADFDIANSVCEEKLDGSLIGLYHDGVKWCHCSRSLAYAEGPLNTNVKYKTFGELIDNEIDLSPVYMNGNKDFSYIFELMSPFDPHVVKPEKTEMYLLAVRNKKTGEYADKHAEGSKIGWSLYPKEYHFDTIENIINTAKSLPFTEEGYVCRNGGRRIKIKSPAHVAAFSLRTGGLTEEKVIQLVQMHEEDEYLSYYPEDVEFFTPWIKIRENMEVMFNSFYEKSFSEERKQFALNLSAAGFDPVLKAILFKMHENGGRFGDALNKIPDEKIFKLYQSLKLIGNI